MKQGERFTFQLIPPSLRAMGRNTRHLVIPMDNNEWWDRKFLTSASIRGRDTPKIWFFMALNPAYKNKEVRASGETPFIFQKMYADFELEDLEEKRGRGIVGSPVIDAVGNGGSLFSDTEEANWASDSDIFIITKESSSLINWDKIPWSDLK